MFVWFFKCHCQWHSPCMHVLLLSESNLMLFYEAFTPFRHTREQHIKHHVDLLFDTDVSIFTHVHHHDLQILLCCDETVKHIHLRRSADISFWIFKSDSKWFSVFLMFLKSIFFVVVVIHVFILHFFFFFFCNVLSQPVSQSNYLLYQ